jgi:TRAP transporter TAXI family solute receptor
MKTKGFKVLAVLTIVALFVLGFSSSTAFALKKRPKFIKIAASSMGGTWFPVCAATGEVLNRHIKKTIFTTTLGGSISTLKKIDEGTLYMGLSGGSTCYEAAEGIGTFKKPTKKSRTLGVYYSFPMNLVVRANSDIRSVKDLDGKNISGGKKGWSTELFFRHMLQANGLSYDSVKAKGGHVIYAGWGQLRSMFKDRKLDCMIDPSPHPSPGIMEISALIPIRLLDLGPEIEKIRKLNQGYVTIKCPGGTYRGQDKDVTQLGNPTVMLISSDIKDDLAYEITKTIFENTKEISKVHKVLKNFSIKNAFDGAYLPLHPGSYKYYKEKGVTIPAHLKP